MNDNRFQKPITSLNTIGTPNLEREALDVVKEYENIRQELIKLSGGQLDKKQKREIAQRIVTVFQRQKEVYDSMWKKSFWRKKERVSSVTQNKLNNSYNELLNRISGMEKFGLDQGIRDQIAIAKPIRKKNFFQKAASRFRGFAGNLLRRRK